MRFGKLLGRPAIMFERHDGYCYAIVNQKYSGYRVAYGDWDDLDSLTFGPIGEATRKRVIELWEQRKKSTPKIE